MDPRELLSICKLDFEKLLKKSGNVSATLGIHMGGRTEYLGLGTDATTADKDKLYLLASMTKPILAVLIAIVFVSERLELEMPVNNIIPLCATCNHRDGAPLRVLDLLDHRSEFFRCDRLWEGPEGRIGIQDGCTILELYRHLLPNRKYSKESSFDNDRNYNNLCYAILAMIIEKITGRSWAEVVYDKIFDPLGMTRSTANLCYRKPDGNVTDSYCAGIKGQELADILGDDDANPAAVHERFLARVRNTNPVAVAQRVQPSQCSDGTCIGGGVGIRSTASDMLTFVNACNAFYSTKPGAELTEFKAGVAVLHHHIGAMVGNPTWAYAGGWNTVFLPWDEVQRAPGADGENYARLQAVANLDILGFRDKKDFWPFFQAGGSRQIPEQLALFHGGNMVGATSCVISIPSRGLTVVALCDTRNFYVDVPNLMVVMLADSLWSGRSKEEVLIHLKNLHSLSNRCIAWYMAEVGRYEKELSSNCEELAQTLKYRQCIGKYTCIFLEILPNDAGNLLELRYAGYQYPLKVKRGSTSEKLTMTYAMPMEWAHKTGLGGKHWLDHKAYEITFLGDSGGGYKRLFWSFEQGIDEKTAFNKVAD
ncbi:beta-lactamase/transpeptidase-like protein [Cercophora newfieldiana]|uniref:Beta-lactamase/transpeptidase-like protein n=1 Tax=Cercophora newfieldiana TaxID=92897 RepID=A0AA39Y0T5_9PEZI|nr:beta-lactamase/transpeptidase-like protein [Cercophora newfieldiana]